MGFGGVGFIVDEGDDDDGGEVAEFGGEIEDSGCEGELGLDSVGGGANIRRACASMHRNPRQLSIADDHNKGKREHHRFSK
jgi:hypothetical protein